MYPDVTESEASSCVSRSLLKPRSFGRTTTRSVLERLLYGAHVVGLAQASLSRALPGMATVVGWHGCDHTGPAFEQDVLSFRHTLLDATPAGSGRVFAVQVEGFAHRTAEPDHILDWTVMAAAP